jgi:hypothetical protein
VTTNSVLNRPVTATRRIGWPRDLLLGLRLAVGGGRTSVARLVLGTIGVGMATAVLLVSASIGHVLSNQHVREVGAEPNNASIPGVAALQYTFSGTQFRGMYIQGAYLRATGQNSPVPPGLARLPGPNEIVLSPALASFLNSPDGALLRPRFPQRVLGLIEPEGLVGPQTMTYYAGLSPEQIPADHSAPPVYSFGRHGDQPSRLNPTLQVMIVIGVVVLLVPILIMVSISSRIAGAQRDRRLAALRLVGAGARQVRRIAAAESLASAATGLVLGAVLFLVFRQIVPSIEVLDLSAFTADVSPPWQLIVLIVLLVPVLAVGSALFALRRTVIEPLGVVRHGRPVRRRVWWRAAMVVIGVALLFYAHELRTGSQIWTLTFAAGSSAVLVGVPVLLPWLLERTVAGIRGGPVSWQLAVRRLQLESGTPARVIGGVAVVLAGAIALQTVVAATSIRLTLPTGRPATPGLFAVHSDANTAAAVNAALARSRVVRAAHPTSLMLMKPDVASPNNFITVQIASCDAVQALIGVTGCRDGNVYADNTGPDVAPGTRLTAIAGLCCGHDPVTAYGQWTVPPLTPTGHRSGSYLGESLLITPGALAGVRLPPALAADVVVQVDPALPDSVEYVRNAVAAYPLQVNVFAFDDPAVLNLDQQTFVAIRDGLLAGSLFTLLLAGVSLLVLALEQVRERRRPLAMQSAAGVPRAVLARSLLWQTALPVGVGVLAAVATGIGLAALVLRTTTTRMVLDWTDIGLFCGATVVLVLLVTAATLPALRNATRLSALRTE